MEPKQNSDQQKPLVKLHHECFKMTNLNRQEREESEFNLSVAADKWNKLKKERDNALKTNSRLKHVGQRKKRTSFSRKDDSDSDDSGEGFDEGEESLNKTKSKVAGVNKEPKVLLLPTLANLEEVFRRIIDFFKSLNIPEEKVDANVLKKVLVSQLDNSAKDLNHDEIIEQVMKKLNKVGLTEADASTSSDSAKNPNNEENMNVD